MANYPQMNSERKSAQVSLCRLRVHGNVTTPAAASEWQALCEKLKKQTDKETSTQIRASANTQIKMNFEKRESVEIDININYRGKT